MNKQDKGRIYRFVNENSFLVTKVGDGYEKEHFVIDVPEFFDFLKELRDESEKIVIPKFVAEYLEYRKENFPVGGLFAAAKSFQQSELKRWMNNNAEVFAQAWTNGYEVEKEPLYFIEKDGMYFRKWIEDGTIASFVTSFGPGGIEGAKKYQSKEKATIDADIFGGVVKLYKEDMK